MNKIITPDSETISDDNAKSFYKLISDGTGFDLSPETDILELSFYNDRSQNANKKLLIICEINKKYKVGIKRCMDVPDYHRREKIISEAKDLLAFPNYKMLDIRGIVLHTVKSQQSKIFSGWEDKQILVIDFGKNLDRVTLKDLTIGIPLEKFCINFGKWTAFNYLLGVIDRHDRNFLYSFSTDEIHSIDNEIYQIANKPVGSRQIFNPPKKVIKKFLAAGNYEQLSLFLRQGFIEGWDCVIANISNMSILNSQEISVLRQKSSLNSGIIFNKFFA